MYRCFGNVWQQTICGRASVLSRRCTPSSIYAHVNGRLPSSSLNMMPLLVRHLQTIGCREAGKSVAGEMKEEIEVRGWLESSRIMRNHWFGVVRDATGRVQFIMENIDKERDSDMLDTPIESVVRVIGNLKERPPNQVKSDAERNELAVTRFQLLNAAKPELPITVRLSSQRYEDAYENKFRYLDLRKDVMQLMLRVRASVALETRMFLSLQRGFMEVETPLLQAKTVGGAEEFIVPSGMHHVEGETREPLFYALPQSPQQHKQMLMASGVEKYFQIAKCFRNEPMRSDRQPEFTQVDIEMAFVESSAPVLQLTRDWLKHVWSKLHDSELCVTREQFDSAFKEEWPVLAYEDAMNRFGCDKPDLRWTEMQLIDVSGPFGRDKNEGTLRAINLKAKYTQGNVSDDDLSGIFMHDGEISARHFVVRVAEDGELKMGSGGSDGETLMLLMSEYDTIAPVLVDRLNMEVGDVVVFSEGGKGVSEWRETCESLGRTRNWLIQKYNLLPESAKNKHAFCWIVDFPMFERNKKSGMLQSVHHPFTAPLSSLPALPSNEQELLELKANAYDLVLNGVEVGGGSVRIHDVQLQAQVIGLLRIHEQCGHYLDMLSSGCPPHGGIAIGLDRLLSIVLSDTHEPLRVRDVIPFPKTTAGKDHAIRAPSRIASTTLRDIYGLSTATK